MSNVILNERYRLLDRLGDGGMAVVWRAHDQRLGREVAVKVLRPQYASDPNFVARFRREAHAAAALNHAHIASVHDTGEDGGQHYIVMELLAPYTLKDEIVQRGPLPVEQALSIAMQVCQALHHAHSRQPVHRDIKPQNILFTAEGQVKVTDFGISRALTSDSLTETGTILGSVHYISPEQVQGQPATPQSDLYSLGVVLYEMLTGQPPYQGDTPIAVAFQVVQGHYVSTRTLNSRIPLAVDQVVRRAMACDPAQRFKSAQEMLLALQSAQAPDPDQTQVMADSLDRTEVMTQPEIPRTYPRRRYEADRVRRSRPPWVAIGLGMLAACFAVMAGIMGYGRYAAKPTASTAEGIHPPQGQQSTLVSGQQPSQSTGSARSYTQPNMPALPSPQPVSTTAESQPQAMAQATQARPLQQPPAAQTSQPTAGVSFLPQPNATPPQGTVSTGFGQNAGQPGERDRGTGGMLVACPQCSGSGWMVCPYCLISGDAKCRMCGGRKQVTCWLCGGKGQARRTEDGRIADVIGGQGAAAGPGTGGTGRGTGPGQGQGVGQGGRWVDCPMSPTGPMMSAAAGQYCDHGIIRSRFNTAEDDPFSNLLFKEGQVCPVCKGKGRVWRPD